MTLADWTRGTLHDIRQNGVRRGSKDAAHELWLGALRRLGRLGYRSGYSTYEREWDVLVILDACRVDLLREVADEYSFIGDVETHPSPASMSRTWMNRTFTPEYSEQIRSTAYVTGNPYSADAIDAGDFETVDEVWRYAWDDEAGTILPRSITDRAIRTWRDHRPGRLVVHYMQPHYPFVTASLGHGIDLDSFDEEETPSVWKRLQSGDLDHEETWTAYRRNLEYVLDDVALLLDNIDADRVAISADHGNAFGEAGIYGHPHDVPLDCLRTVPWVETTATDTGEYEPELERSDADGDVTDRLEALGYK
ncbi:hypothetical protein M0R89_17355 [Halorussus limi]|uniref:AlkP-core domain protein n=1 Tax=Halorussus limi TaxID=2938695 RepID=A0A8U0HTG2_9EURY|nr:hypothetical protein [Halorussus limi]UPV74290.1 hypothetical protein M0R89_17355 [Halorussus limi]